MININRSVSSWFTPAFGDFNVERVGFCLGLAGLTLGQALQSGSGFFNLQAIIWLTISLIFLGYGLGTSRRSLPDVFKKISIPILIFGLIWQVYQLGNNTLPKDFFSSTSTSPLWFFRPGVALAGCLALLSLLPKTWVPLVWQNILVGLVLLIMWFLGVLIIKAFPPFIDTFVFQQTSSEALLRGQNPYTLTPPNIYPDMRFYGAELVKDGKMTFGNPYPPLSIYVSTLGYLMGGDIRYSHLLAVLLSGALIAFLHPGRESKLAAYIFLFTPRVFYVIDLSWTEPIVVFFLVAAVFCAIHYPRWLPLMLGLLFASKQYLIFIIPLTMLLIPPKSFWRNWINFYGWVGGTMIVVTAPLAFWDLSAFLWNVGALQWYQVFRLDALSYLAFYAIAFNQTPSQLISFIALAIAFLLVWRFASRTPVGFSISVAWCLGVFFAFNKQAFCNYYFLVIGAICCALASLTVGQQLLPQESMVSAER